MKSRLYIPEKKLQKEFLPSDYFDSPSMNETNQKKPKIKKVNLSFLINKHQKEKDSKKEQNNEQKAENANGQDTKDQIKATQSTNKIETDSNTKSTNNKTETSDTKTPTNNKTETPDTKTPTNNKTETPDTKTPTNNKTETPDTKSTTDKTETPETKSTTKTETPDTKSTTKTETPDTKSTTKTETPDTKSTTKTETPDTKTTNNKTETSETKTTTDKTETPDTKSTTKTETPDTKSTTKTETPETKSTTKTETSDTKSTTKTETPDTKSTTKTETPDTKSTTKAETPETNPKSTTDKTETPNQSSMTENELLIDYFTKNNFNSNPIEFSNETKRNLSNDIYPIINPINLNLKKDIDISIKLIKYLQSAKQLDESISFIVQEFYTRIYSAKSMDTACSFAYILSRVTDLCQIEGKSLKLTFFKEFQSQIPWLVFNKKFSDSTIDVKIMKNLIGFIFYWFSYDTQLVEFISIPIIENVIQNNNLEKFGCFIEAFFESSSLIAFNICPDKLSNVFSSLKTKLDDYKSDKFPAIFRLKNIIKIKIYPLPFSLQYTDIEDQNIDKIADTAGGDE